MLSIRRVSTALGAEVQGVDLTKPLTAEIANEIKRALDEHSVLFFKEQKKLSIDEHIILAENFGVVDLPLFRTPSSNRPEVLILDQITPDNTGSGNFHSDNTFRAAPTMGSILQAHLVPPVGGGTCWASACAAYEGLSAPLQKMLEGLTAEHSLAMMKEKTEKAGATFRESTDKWPPRSHPVIAVHPRTKRKVLYVNKNWTSHIEGLPREESDAILAFLYNHVTRPEYQTRLDWEEGDVAFWDNLATQHYPVRDYTSRRILQRVAISGEEVVGTASAHGKLRE